MRLLELKHSATPMIFATFCLGLGLVAALPAQDVTTSACTTIVTSTTASDCSSRTVCWDGINECGMMYGGCFPDCTPWPTFEPPPCTTTKPGTLNTTTNPGTLITTTNRPTVITTRTSDCAITCWDGINNCGQTYGGCWPGCSQMPTFTAPECPITTTATSTCAEATICVDSVNSCGMTYGSCFPNCAPWPSMTPPPCPTLG